MSTSKIIDRCVNAIEQDIRNRATIGLVWNDIHPETQEEIKQAWFNIVEDAIRQAEIEYGTGDAYYNSGYGCSC